MTIEALACPSCGSTQVKEIKAGTYFCDHCESLFKHVDPTQVSVAPAFCSCGNQITRQCNVCRVGLCASCEAASPDQSWRILIGVSGYGYRLSPSNNISSGKATSSYRTIRHSSVVPMDPGSDWTSLVMPAAKLYTVLEEREAVKHVCWDCLASGIPRLAAAIERGTICEDPFCPKPALAQCKCCQKHYCAAGLVGDRESAIVTLADKPEAHLETLAFPVDWPPGVCWACAQEGTARMWDVIRREFALIEAPQWRYSFDVVGRPDQQLDESLPRFRLSGGPRHPTSVPTESTSRGDRRRYRNDRETYLASLPRALDESTKVADELGRRWHQEQFDGPCSRSVGIWHREVTWKRFPPNIFIKERHSAYVVVDERDGGAPSALTGLTAGS